MPFRLPGLSDLFSQYGVSVSMKTEPSSMDPPGLARSPCPHLLGEVLQALGVAPAPFVAGHLLERTVTSWGIRGKIRGNHRKNIEDVGKT